MEKPRSRATSLGRPRSCATLLGRPCCEKWHCLRPVRIRSTSASVSSTERAASPDELARLRDALDERSAELQRLRGELGERGAELERLRGGLELARQRGDLSERDAELRRQRDDLLLRWTGAR
eukprot:gene11240-biopygen3343